MNFTNFFNIKVSDQPIAVVDDFFSDDIVKNWLSYYQYRAEFKYAVEEAEGGDAYFCHCLELPTVESIFNMSETLLPVVNEFNNLYNCDLKYTDMCRAHVNFFQSVDRFKGHVDSNEQGMVILWFANPHIEDTGGGFYLGEGEDQLHIHNKFNRIVVFPATMWHKTEELTSRDSIRLSVYIGFSTFDINETRQRNYKQKNLLNKFARQGVAHG